MSNTVPSRLAMKLARYCSSSARFRRQKAARTRKAERATRNLIGSPPHRSVLTNAPTPRDAVRQDPNGEPDDLPAEPLQDGVRALHRAGEEIDGKGEHGAEPQHSSDARDGGRQQGERGDPPRQEQGHPGVQLHDRRGARRPERQQSRREADEEPHRGREQHRYGRDRPPAGVERQSHGGPRRGHQQPDHEDDARRARLVRDVLRHGLVGGVQRPGEPVVEVAFTDPAIQIPGIPGDGQLVDEHDGKEVAGEVGARVPGDLSLSRDRPPDTQRDRRLGHAPQEPEHDRRPVLEVDQPGVADQRRVPADHSSSSTPRAKARRITSSIGGSSIDRSATENAASSRALVAGASSRRTSSTAFGKRKLFTAPNAASASAVTRLPSPPPPPSTNSIRLVRAIRATSASSAPSYSRRPRLIIRTRYASAVTSCM